MRLRRKHTNYNDRKPQSSTTSNGKPAKYSLESDSNTSPKDTDTEDYNPSEESKDYDSPIEPPLKTRRLNYSQSKQKTKQTNNKRVYHQNKSSKRKSKLPTKPSRSPSPPKSRSKNIKNKKNAKELDEIEGK